MTATPLGLCSIRREPDATVIVADGEIDMSSCPRLREALLDALENGTTVLDVAQVGFCDSAGVRTLVEVQRAASIGGIALRLVAPSEAVGRVLELAGAAGMFEIHPDVPAALKA